MCYWIFFITVQIFQIELHRLAGHMGGHFLYSLAQYRISALYMLYVSIWYLLRINGKLLTLCMHVLAQCP